MEGCEGDRLSKFKYRCIEAIFSGGHVIRGLYEGVYATLSRLKPLRRGIDLNFEAVIGDSGAAIVRRQIRLAPFRKLSIYQSNWHLNSDQNAIWPLQEVTQ
jgi:hypothetical protein